jgi:hypothetical protein
MYVQFALINVIHETIKVMWLRNVLYQSTGSVAVCEA